MSMVDKGLGMGPVKAAAVLCPVVECAECGGEALMVRRSRESVTVACPTCATVVLTPRWPLATAA